MNELFSKRIKKLIDLEDKKVTGLRNNKVANFAYTSIAYEKEDAEGVDAFNITHDNNIPKATPVATETDKTVLDRGYRSQGASLSRMLMNHFLGRTSYNLNKIHDWFSEALGILQDIVVSGIWDLTKDVDSSPNIPDFDVAAPGTYKGRDFSGITLSCLPEWIQQEPTDYGEWTLIVEQGFKFKRQFLYYTRSKNSAPEFGDYLAIRTFSYDDDREVYAAGQWTSKAVDADHALVSDTLNEGATMGGVEIPTIDWKPKNLDNGANINGVEVPTINWKPKNLDNGANINGVAVATTEDVTNLTKDKATVAQVNAMFQYTASSKTLNIVPIR